MTLIEIIEESRARRLSGQAPNYELTHHCSQCGQDYLCPDRYTSQSCAPTDWWKSRGKDNQIATCSPCAASFASPERAAWYEAHGINDLQPKEQAA